VATPTRSQSLVYGNELDDRLLDFVPHVKPEQYGTAEEIAADGAIVINRALAAARPFGLWVVIHPDGYRVKTMVNAGSNGSKLMGYGGGKSKLKVYEQPTMMNAVIGHYGNASNVQLRDFVVEGTIIDDVTEPRRSRTQTSNGFNSAVKFYGDLAPAGVGVVRNVTIERVEVIGAAGLPIWFSGVRGDSRLNESHMELTMDVGFTWCERVFCTDNTSVKSADNGFSISRGCQSVVATGNQVAMAAYWGVWIAGFKDSGAATDAGPSDFTVFGNVVKDVGKGGICADDAPRKGTIVGNTVERVRRGPVDEPSNVTGVGILIGGFPNDNRPNPTIWAEDILVTANTLIDCARGGIQYVGARNIDIKNNTIIRPGSQFMADGVTPVSSTAVDQNFGISTLNGAQSTSRNINIVGNTITDDRATPYMNYPFYASGVTGARIHGNDYIGARQAGAVIDDTRTNVFYSGVHIFQAGIKFTAGATAGASAATGTVLGWAITGAAGAARLLNEILTAGVRRWTVRGSGDLETGGNVGTRYTITAYDDAGASLYPVLEARRESGAVQLGRQVTTLGRPTPASCGNGGILYDTDLKKYIVADVAGNVFRDFVGTVV
jgi:hypothetical protein